MKSAALMAIFLIFSIGYSQPVSAYDLNLKFINLNNKETSLSIYEGSYLFVEAFATWCGSCKIEMAHLNELYNAVGDQIQMISLSTDPEDTIQKINKFKDEFSAAWDFGLDHKSQFSRKYPLSNYPAAYFFDGDGKILLSWMGITKTSKFLNDMKPYIDVPVGFDQDDELGIYSDEILSNPTFLITIGILSILVVLHLVLKKFKVDRSAK